MKTEKFATPEIFKTAARMAAVPKPVAYRRRIDGFFKKLCASVTCISAALLIILLGAIVIMGYQALNLQFLSAPPSPDAASAGFFPAVMGSVWLLGLVMCLALPLGVGSSI